MHASSLAFDNSEDDVLDSTLVFSDEEIYLEFQECCERGLLRSGVVRPDLRESARALVRMLDRNSSKPQVTFNDFGIATV